MTFTDWYNEYGCLLVPHLSDDEIREAYDDAFDEGYGLGEWGPDKYEE